MFRPIRGFKAQYHYLTLLVGCDFDACNVVLLAPGVLIQGARQFTEDKAREHAQAVAKSYIHEEKHEDLPVIENLDWKPFEQGEWLSWRP